jgi:hypothetical protein
MMTDRIDITGLDKAELLAALYNNSQVQGMGFLQAEPGTMTASEARRLLEARTYFDYLKGRVMKIDLSGDTLDPWGYDQRLRAGRNAAHRG